MNFMRNEQVTPDQKLNEEVAIFSLLDESLVSARNKEEENRYKERTKSLGCGRIGHPMAPVYYERGCERAVWYEYKMYPKEKPFGPKLYRIFEMGKYAEDIVVENLRLAGFEVITLDPDTGKQIGFELAHDPETGKPRVKGFCDGVIVSGPAEYKGLKLKYPMLWENKALKKDKFNKFVEEGVERSHPLYYAQIQMYQNFLNLYQNPALLTVLCRETGDLRAEFVRYNQRHCQAVIDRAARIIETTNSLTLERAAKDYQKLPCKFCDFSKQCQMDENSRAKSTVDPMEAPGWLGKKTD